ncbi:hypothetical protein CFC21_034736 [Triticum aestivum]|uniref:Uncharacterized protein n=3 Tax=Triticum TaxID=4564 RepID=A0A9R0VJ68_TRITD|nr:hypothetical protein CFC21_034736 [Triticum aestivum]VAH59125.1 unnamed protein product [Triticum turgidum subsp. durum]
MSTVVAAPARSMAAPSQHIDGRRSTGSQHDGASEASLEQLGHRRSIAARWKQPGPLAPWKQSCIIEAVEFFSSSLVELVAAVVEVVVEKLGQCGGGGGGEAPAVWWNFPLRFR